MAIHFQLLFSTVLYILVVVGSIVEIATIAYAKSAVDGRCYLFVRDAKSAPSVFTCSLNIYAYGGATIYAVIMAVYHGYGTVVASRENHIGRTMWVMPWLLLNTLITVLVFICACVYSIGLYISCSSTTWIISPTESCNIKNRIYRSMFIAKVSSWIIVLFWCGLIALTVLRLLRNRRALSREVYEDYGSSDLARIGEVVPTA